MQYVGYQIRDKAGTILRSLEAILPKTAWRNTKTVSRQHDISVELYGFNGKTNGFDKLGEANLSGMDSNAWTFRSRWESDGTTVKHKVSRLEAKRSRITSQAEELRRLGFPEGSTEVRQLRCAINRILTQMGNAVRKLA